MYSIFSIECNFQVIRKKTESRCTKRPKESLKRLLNGTERVNVQCIGENFLAAWKEGNGKDREGEQMVRERRIRNSYVCWCNTEWRASGGVQESTKKCRTKDKVVERSGQSLRNVLSKSDPFQNNPCGKDTCKVCNVNPKINCKMRDVVYMMKYLGCTENDEREGTYIGETVGSIGERESKWTLSGIWTKLKELSILQTRVGAAQLRSARRKRWDIGCMFWGRDAQTSDWSNFYKWIKSNTKYKGRTNMHL